MPDLQPFVDTAIAAARAAEAVIKRYYHGEFKVEYKADASPVTVADVECEAAIKAVLAEAFPAHGFYGEELGGQDTDAEYVWLIDPIDGTKSFVRGYPFFSTQIALARRGELLVGVSNAPVFNGGELAWAARGRGAFLNNAPIRVSNVDTLAKASLSLGNIASLATSKAWGPVGELLGQVHRGRGYGDFYHYHLLAAGKIDAVIETDVDILDIAAVTVLVREAGGDVSTLGGADIGLDARSVFATNGCLRGAIAPFVAAWGEDTL